MKRTALIPAALALAACAPPAPGATAVTPPAKATPPVLASAQPAASAPAATAVITSTSPLSVTVLPDPASAVWRPVIDGFRRPLGLAHAGDARIFVIEQRGVIWVVEGEQRLPNPFLDIRDRVNDRANEQGLLGLAFHPGFPQDDRLFVDYTGARGQTVIASFRQSADPKRADAASEEILLEIEQPYGNHNGGGLAFGPDGYLYIGMGDGGSAGDPHGNAQRLDTLLGKILRLDVDHEKPYTIPPDNPFAEGGGRAEIWDYGLRNPWRFAFDRATGDLYIGDVGQNAWEEIHYQPASVQGGTNFGWNVREGLHPYAGGSNEGLVDPVAEYGHEEGCSVTGGFVVRDEALQQWQGVYLYGDYCSGVVWGLLRDDAGEWMAQPLFKTGAAIASFGEDASGRIYLIDHGGTVYRLEPAP